MKDDSWVDIDKIENKEKESIEHEQVVLVNIKVICHDMYKSGKKLFFVLLTDLWLEALVEGNFHY